MGSKAEIWVKREFESNSPRTVLLTEYHLTSLKFIQLVESQELHRSISPRGNCWGNAPQENFFGHMKDELASSFLQRFCNSRKASFSREILPMFGFMWLAMEPRQVWCVARPAFAMP